MTFFFNGGREDQFENEDRILVNSPKVPTYDLLPEMSAQEVTEKLTEVLKTGKEDMVILNFANGDMVGHTGVFSAICRAVAKVDKCVKEVVETAVANDYVVLLTADHGNADHAYNEDGRFSEYCPLAEHRTVHRHQRRCRPCQGRQARGCGSYHPETDGNPTACGNDWRGPYIIKEVSCPRKMTTTFNNTRQIQL